MYLETWRRKKTFLVSHSFFFLVQNLLKPTYLALEAIGGGPGDQGGLTRGMAAMVYNTGELAAPVESDLLYFSQGPCINKT